MNRVAFIYPVTLTPVVVITATLLVLVTLIATLPFGDTVTLLFPLTSEVPALATIPVNKLPLPLK